MLYKCRSLSEVGTTEVTGSIGLTSDMAMNGLRSSTKDGLSFPGMSMEIEFKSL